MTRAMTLSTLALASALLTPVLVVAAGAGATSGAPGVVNASASIQTAQASPSQVAPASSLEAACPRRVKVVYAGYGEGQDPRCPAAPAAKR